MKRKYLLFVFLMSGFLFYVGGDYIFSAGMNEDELIDEAFNNNVFDKTEAMYGVSSIGIGQAEKIVTVRMGEKNSNKDEVKQYFENYLSSIGISDYEVEVFTE